MVSWLYIFSHLRFWVDVFAACARQLVQERCVVWDSAIMDWKGYLLLTLIITILMRNCGKFS